MKDYNCEKHGPYQGETENIMGTIWEVSCPSCHDEFVVSLRKDEERQKRDDFKRSMEWSNIEPAYHTVSLVNFVAETQEQQINKAKTQDLIDGKVKKLVMTGKNGTGKTHLACSALHKLGGKIMTMYEISTTIRASYTAKADKTELEIVDALARLPLFVIDELGRTKGGEADQNWLSYILDKRHVRGLPTIIITNKHIKKSCEAEGCPECLENYITEDVMSRLSENGVMARFSGEDWRRKK